MQNGAAEEPGVAALLPRPKRVALLAYLAAARPHGFHRRDKLHGLFWQEATQDRARRALNQALFVLREGLGRDAIVTRGDAEVALNEERFTVDVRAFGEAVDSADHERAVQWYRGDFLEAFFISEAPEFEWWVDQERSTLRQRAIASAFALVEALDGQGRYLEAVDRARWATAMAPLDEVVLRRLLELLDAHGDRATARREYDRFARRLAEDAGHEPSPETQAMMDRINARRAPRAGDAPVEPVQKTEVTPVADVADDGLSPRQLLERTLAGRYEIGRAIGMGGMSLVFLAQDLTQPRKVAVKVLRPHLLSTIGVERFLQEIRIAAALQHPNIVPLYESGRAGRLPYYVMPFVEGESLEARLTRKTQLAVDEAIGIAREVASALGTAHSHGVVHRDIKPGNILLEAGHAVVSDFGIARAVTEAGGVRLTETGVRLGTPGYMSPEQIDESRVDGRSDIYGLACVLYEMLAGEAPFTGPTAQSIYAKQLTLPPPSVLTVRKTVPPGVDKVIRHALATVPADRYATAAEFDAALHAASLEPPLPLPPPRRVGHLAPSLVMAAGAAVVFFSREKPPPDPLHYAILPFQYEGSAGAPLNELQRLHDALSRWEGFSIADPFDVREALADDGGASLTRTAATRLARGRGAGRYVRGAVSPLGGSLRVHGALYDAVEDGTLVANYAVRIPRDLEGADSLFAKLADHLLFPSLPEGEPALSGTRSFPARRAFDRGQDALEVWDLDRADSAFSAATAVDPDYAQAHLWIALARAWRGAERASWRIDAEQAALGKESLSDQDRVTADAILAEARDDLGQACPLWQRHAGGDPRDFAAWYGLAQCLRGDDAVVRDTASPSGWRFRTSYHRALLAYQRAFELRPSILVSFRRGSYESLRQLFRAGGNERRAGRGLSPDTTGFSADPHWQADTIAWIPYPQNAPRPRRAASPEEAVRHLRKMLREVAVAWVAFTPASGDAMEALAVSMALLADPSALLIHSALGGPEDSLALLERRVRIGIEETLRRGIRCTPSISIGAWAPRSRAAMTSSGASRWNNS